MSHSPQRWGVWAVAMTTITLQVDPEAPLLQKYNLFKRAEVSSGKTGALGLSITSPVKPSSSSSSPSLLSSSSGMPHTAQDTSPQSAIATSSRPVTKAGDGFLTTSPGNKIPFAEQDRSGGKLTQLQSESSSSSTSVTAVSSKSTILPSNTHLVNITSLPDHKNEVFASWLHVRLFGKGDNSMTPMEKIKHVLWCPVVQYSKTGFLLPCCAVLTERRIFILQLKNKDSHIEGAPEMETFYILPLCNIQQVVIGLCYSFIRIEESFVGSSGTFAFLASDPDTGREFFEELNALCDDSGENGELDVVNNSQSDDLSQQIFDMEEERGECSGRIAFATHVFVDQTGQLAYLLMSENLVYIITSDVLFWPRPTFDMSKRDTPAKFDIAQQFSIEGKISEINMFSGGDNDERQGKVPIMPTYNIRYQVFGLSMMFHELLGSHKFSFCFFSVKNRDMFLDRLTNLRSEHAHRMSPTIREEPEGGNELSESSGSGSLKKTSLSVPFKNANISDSDESFKSADEEHDKIVQDIVSPSQRKLRAKTEIVISKSPNLGSEEPRDVPSYTWHYLSPELIKHLDMCIKQYSLAQDLTPKLRSLTEMSGELLAQLFHQNVVPVGVEGEELHHIVWTNVIPYTNPADEIVTCVMLSNRAVYFVSDRTVNLQQTSGRPSWMTHARHVSDSVIGLHARMTDAHHSAGIIYSSESDGAIIKPYCILEFSEIDHINVGLFDQCFRLTGNKKETVFTLVTRSSETTSQFMKTFSTMLSLYISSPMLDKSSGDLEQDFYKAFNKRTKTTIEGMEYVHPSKVKFCYPGDEAISDLLFLINEHLRMASLKAGKENIVQYILGYKMKSVSAMFSPVLLEPISIILTDDCLCFVKEDLISYPLPDFVRGLPSTPRHEVKDVKKIEYIKHISQSKEDPRDITLVFSDEKEDIVIVQDHYSEEARKGRQTPPEIPLRLFIQSERDMNKLVSLLKSKWREKHSASDTELLIIQN